MKAALLNIDVQKPWAGTSPRITSAIKEFTAKARGAMPVIWAYAHWLDLRRPLPPFEAMHAGDLAWIFNAKRDYKPALLMQPHDWVVCKDGSNAFDKTGLDKLLKALEVDHLYMTGFMTGQCVFMTAEDAVKYAETTLFSDLTADGVDQVFLDNGDDFARFREAGVKIMDSRHFRF